MLFMALLPGIPVIPFLALGTGASALAFIIDKRTKLTAAVEAKKTETAAKADAADEPIASGLEMDDLKVELGYALLPLVNAPDGSDRLTEQIKALRRSLAVEIGIRHARCSNSRQRAARRELLRYQSEGSRGRQRQGLVRAIHGFGSGPAGR